MARTAAEIQTDIDTYTARLDALLDPARAASMKRGDREISFSAGADMEDRIRRRLQELKAELARVTGAPSPYRPVGV